MVRDEGSNNGTYVERHAHRRADVWTPVPAGASASLRSRRVHREDRLRGDVSDDRSKIPAVEIAVRTDPGRDPDKQVNEDSAGPRRDPARPPRGRLRRHGRPRRRQGSLRARDRRRSSRSSRPRRRRRPPRDALKRAIEEANARVWSMPTAEAGYRPGLDRRRACSRTRAAPRSRTSATVALYLVHAGAISQVTRDHSMVQEMVDRNLIRAEDAAKHPDANKILRALGIAKEVEVDLRPEPIAYVAGDVFVLCSDGLSDLVEPAEILEIAGLASAGAGGRPARRSRERARRSRQHHGDGHPDEGERRRRATAGDRTRRGVAKTIPLTAHIAPPPADRAAGPTGTVRVRARRAVTPIPQAPSSVAAVAAAARCRGPPGRSASLRLTIRRTHGGIPRTPIVVLGIPRSRSSPSGNRRLLVFVADRVRHIVIRPAPGRRSVAGGARMLSPSTMTRAPTPSIAPAPPLICRPSRGAGMAERATRAAQSNVIRDSAGCLRRSHRTARREVSRTGRSALSRARLARRRAARSRPAKRRFSSPTSHVSTTRAVRLLAT